MTVAYVLLGRLGLSIEPVNAFATLVWPPTGIALAALVLYGYRYWPSVALGAVIVNLWTGAPVPVALLIGAGNTLEALAGAYALRRIPGFRSSLDRLQDVLGLVFFGAVLSTAVSATIGSLSLLLGRIITPGGFGTTWRAWWLGDSIGDLIVAPLILTWGDRSVVSFERRAEAATLALLLLAGSLFLFEITSDGMVSLLSPLLVWAAIRFGQRGAPRAMLLVSMIAIWATARGHGPFVRATIPESLFHLQLYTAVTAATFLVLGAVVAERGRVQEELARSLAAKDEFFAALSHELRTPLTPVLAISSVLEKSSELSARTRTQMQVVRRNAELEARLIDDLLDLTRIARGKLGLERQAVSLEEALDHVAEICRDEAAVRGVTLEREDATKGTLVLADPTRLRQIFWNLVKNAIKFTPRGGRVRLAAFAASEGRVAVDVSDTGIGIEPGEIRRIFQPFRQAVAGRGGLGLGLAIAKELVEAHGGTLSAVSGGSGRGATFRVELARCEEAGAARVQGVERRVTRPARARRILLVEDHADTLAAASGLLGELSCEVVGATSVAEALAAAAAAAVPFDLVISDLGLPDGSGLDLMRRLRDRHGLSGIAVTGYGMEEDLRRSREAGFVDHVVKPITFERLEGAVERFFARPPTSGARA